MSRFLQYEERNLELYNKFLHFRRDGVGYKDAIRMAAHSSCSRFWVSPYYIYRAFLDLRNGNNKCTCRNAVQSSRKKLEKLLYNECMDLLQRKEFQGFSFHFIICFVVNRPAPSFFISDDRAEKIIRQMHRNYSFDKRYKKHAK